MTSAPHGAPAKRSLVTLLSKAPWRLIGIVLLIVVLVNVDLPSVTREITKLGPAPILQAAAAFAALLVFRFWRWHVLAKAAGVDQSFFQTARSCNASIWLGLASPGRVGEFRRAVDLAASGRVSIGAASALVLFDLLLDLGFFIAVAAGGVFYLTQPGGFGALVFAALAGGALLAVTFSGALIEAVLGLAPPIARIPAVQQVMPLLRRRLPFGRGWQIAAATAGVLGAQSLIIAALTAPMALGLGWAGAPAMAALVGVSGAIPITYFGLGTRELTLIWLFGELGRPASLAIAVSFAFILIYLIGIAVSLMVAGGFRLAEAASAAGQAKGGT